MNIDSHHRVANGDKDQISSNANFMSIKGIFQRKAE